MEQFIINQIGKINPGGMEVYIMYLTGTILVPGMERYTTLVGGLI